MSRRNKEQMRQDGINPDGNIFNTKLEYLRCGNEGLFCLNPETVAPADLSNLLAPLASATS